MKYLIITLVLIGFNCEAGYVKGYYRKNKWVKARYSKPHVGVKKPYKPRWK